MTETPSLRLVRVGSRGFSLAHVVAWEDVDPPGTLRLGFTGGDYCEFSGAEARAVRWHLETQSKELRVDRDSGQRAEPPPPHGARPDPKPDAVLAASAAHWEDPDHDD